MDETSSADRAVNTSKEQTSEYAPPDEAPIDRARHNEYQTSTIARITDFLNLPTEAERRVQKVLAEAAQLVGTDIASVFIYERDRGLRYYTSLGLPPSLIRGIEESGRSEAVARYLEGITSPVIFRRSEKDVLTPLLYDLVRGQGVRTVVAAPLVSEGRAIGFLAVYNRATREYTDEELDRLRMLANMIALLVSRKEKAGGEEPAPRKEHFLNALSHELRTPLTSIMGFAQIIRKRLSSSPDTDARMLDQIEVLCTQAQRLNRLIDTLVDITRIEDGSFAIMHGRVELTSMLRAAVETSLAQMSSQHKVTIEVPDEPVWVRGDKKRLEQVFSHVISNAVRYSPDNEPVTVELAAPDGSGSEEVTITIADRGPGIPAGRRKDILEQTYRTDEPKTGGLGVGLYISKTIVEAHGGHISLQSAPGRGTQVTIVLPV